MKYILRWLNVMYNRHIFRKSHEGQFERLCNFKE